MPTVGEKKFPYTKKGKEDAEKASKKAEETNIVNRNPYVRKA